MTTQAINTLRNHWDMLRDKSLPPMRSDIEPRSMPDVLDTLFILEMLDPQDIRVRIAGLSICEMMGMEVRGQTPLSFFDDNSRGRFAAVLADVMTRPTIARLVLVSRDKLGNIGESEMILLPLRSDLGDVNRIIGCLTTPKKFTAPVRFQVTSIDLESLSSGQRTNKTMTEVFTPSPEYIIDGGPVLRSVLGNSMLKVVKPAEKPNYLNLVE